MLGGRVAPVPPIIAAPGVVLVGLKYDIDDKLASFSASTLLVGSFDL